MGGGTSRDFYAVDSSNLGACWIWLILNNRSIQQQLCSRSPPLLWPLVFVELVLFVLCCCAGNLKRGVMIDGEDQCGTDSLPADCKCCVELKCIIVVHKTFAPCDTVYAVVVCISVSVMSRCISKWPSGTDRAGFWHGGFLPSVPHYIMEIQVL